MLTKTTSSRAKSSAGFSKNDALRVEPLASTTATMPIRKSGCHALALAVLEAIASCLQTCVARESTNALSRRTDAETGSERRHDVSLAGFIIHDGGLNVASGTTSGSGNPRACIPSTKPARSPSVRNDPWMTP